MSDSIQKPTRIRELAQRINAEVKVLVKNVPVSKRNANEHLTIAWELENAARTIKARVQKRTGRTDGADSA